MRFLKYLNEETTTYLTKNIKTENAIEILKTKCKNSLSDILNNKFYLYKGISSNENFLLFDGQGTRKSAYTSNYYTLLFSDILESWKNIPKRNKSLICSLKKSYAKTYGSLYYVIPYDDSSLFGFCDAEDFWNIISSITNINIENVFKDSNISDLNFFNLLFSSAAISEKNLKEFLHTTTIDNLFNDKNNKKNLILFFINLALSINNEKIITKYSVKDIYNNMDLREFVLSEIDNNILNYDLYYILNKTLTPKTFNVKIKKYREIKKYKSEEIWFDKPAILIKESYIEDLQKLL